MSKRHRSQRRKRKTARSSAERSSAAGKRTWRVWLAAVAVCVVGAALTIALQPWRGDRGAEESRGAAGTPGDRQTAGRRPQTDATQNINREKRPGAVGDDGTALDALRKTPSSLSPKEESAYLKKEELQLIQEVTRDFPKNAGALVLLGSFHSRRGNSDKAMAHWERALEMNPRNADVHSRMAEIALGKGNLEESISLWRKALEIQPDMPRAHEGIAEALVRMGRYEDAIGELEKEISAAPPSAPAHLLLGEAYSKQKEFEKAKLHYEAVVRIDPTYAFGYYGLFTVHTRLKQPEKARECLVRFKELKSKDFENLLVASRDQYSDVARIREGLLSAYQQAEQLYRDKGDVRKAEELLQKAVRLKPTDRRSLERLATLYFQTNRMSQALDLYQRLCEIVPGIPGYHLNVGLISSRLGSVDSAEAAFRRAIALAPDDWAAHRELARLYLKTNKNLPAAKEHAGKALRLGKTAENYFVYGWASDVNGDRAEAQRAIEQAMQMEPANQRYKQVYNHIKNKN